MYKYYLYFSFTFCLCRDCYGNQNRQSKIFHQHTFILLYRASSMLMTRMSKPWLWNELLFFLSPTRRKHWRDLSTIFEVTDMVSLITQVTQHFKVLEGKRYSKVPSSRWHRVFEVRLQNHRGNTPTAELGEVYFQKIDIRPPCPYGTNTIYLNLFINTSWKLSTWTSTWKLFFTYPDPDRQVTRQAA